MWLNVEHMLKAIPELQEVDKSFLAQFNKYDPIRASQSSFFMQMGMENPALMKAGFQAYHVSMAGFGADMDDLIGRYMSGRVGYQQAIKSFKNFTGKHYQDLFKAGAQAVGNPYFDELGLDKRSLSFVNKARRAEMKFFKRFLQDIKNPYHRPRHPYMKRAGYYKNSGKAQFFNGMVAGSGDKVQVFWRLGVPQTEHCDVCPQYANHGAYTWQTLPTMPRGGDTPCLFRCYCHLEIKPVTGKMKGGDPDRLLQYGLGSMAPGVPRPTKPGNIANRKGRPITDVDVNLEDLHNSIRGRLNHARQMIEATKGAERAKWIKSRKSLNDMLLRMSKDYPDYRFLPSMAVKDLVNTVRSAMGKGGLLSTRVGELAPGDEIIWVRGVDSGPGVIFLNAQGARGVRFADGSFAMLDDMYDVNFMMNGKGLQGKMAKHFVKGFNPNLDAQLLDDMMTKLDDIMGFGSPEGAKALALLSERLGFQVTPEYVRNFVAKQRLQAYNVQSTRSTWMQRDLFGREAYSPVRADLHERIMRDILAQGKYGNKMVMTGGYSGSGKSSSLSMFDEAWETKYMNINSDNIKSMLAKHDGFSELGFRAGQYHAEANDILKILMRRAVQSGKNVLYDGTMTKLTRQGDFLKLFQDAGYKVTGLFADLPIENSIMRAISRAISGSDKRFVDPFLILSQEGKCINTYKGLQHKFDDWYHYNTNVAFGENPILFDSKLYGGSGTLVGTQQPSASDMSTRTVTGIEKLGGGANESWKVQFDDGTYAVYKPKAGENAGLRDNITYEYTRESMAWEIEKHLKFGQVPETLVLNIPVPTLAQPVMHRGRYIQPSKGVGAYQRWMDGELGGYLSADQYALIPLVEKQKMMLFDLISQQVDRHGKNWLFNLGTRKIVSIDNGLSMPKGGNEFRLSFGRALAGTKIPKELMDAMKRLLAKEATFKAQVAEALKHPLPTEEALAIDRMFKRVKHLVDTGKFPHDLGSYDGSWIYDMHEMDVY